MSGNPNQGVLHQQSCAAITCRIVKIRDAARDKAPDKARVVGLPAPIITFANYRIAEPMQNSRKGASTALVEIARILFQKRWQHSPREEDSGEVGSVSCAEPFRIAFRTLSESRIVIGRPLNSGNSAHPQQCHRIRDRGDEHRVDQQHLIRATASKTNLELRKVFAQSAEVLASVCPCWMASPLSVSQLLDGSRQYFDFVIFDEASQVLPEDAVPAILQGRKAGGLPGTINNYRRRHSFLQATMMNTRRRKRPVRLRGLKVCWT